MAVVRTHPYTPLSFVHTKVETSNLKALSLYRSLGYRPVSGGEDGAAERPVVLGGRLRYEPTTTIALKKDLARYACI